MREKKTKTLITPQFYAKLLRCIELFGIDAFESYMNRYLLYDQLYSCKSDIGTVHIFIKDISHLTIHKHKITIYTDHGTYRKYGSLSNEHILLLPHGFVPCSQSILVAISKIKIIHQKEVILIDGTRLPLSQRYAKKVLLAFSSL